MSRTKDLQKSLNEKKLVIIKNAELIARKDRGEYRQAIKYKGNFKEFIARQLYRFVNPPNGLADELYGTYNDTAEDYIINNLAENISEAFFESHPHDAKFIEIDFN